MVVGSLFLLPVSLPSLVGQDFGRVTLAGWGSLAYAVVLTGVVTNLLYFTAVDRVGPSRAAIFGYLQSFLGVLFAVALLGERVAPIQIAGGLALAREDVDDGRSSRCVLRKLLARGEGEEQELDVFLVGKRLAEDASGWNGRLYGQIGEENVRRGHVSTSCGLLDRD